MNEIIIVPKEIDNAVSYEGIDFSNCTFIDIYLDGISIEEIEDFDSGVVYWEQLQKSCEQEGQYLLFTCYCGNPEDAGWDYITVKHNENEIMWSFERDTELQFVFNKSEYIKQVESCKNLLNLSRYPLAVPISGLPNY